MNSVLLVTNAQFLFRRTRINHEEHEAHEEG
jgi:hypothetical protein